MFHDGGQIYIEGAFGGPVLGASAIVHADEVLHVCSSPVLDVALGQLDKELDVDGRVPKTFGGFIVAEVLGGRGEYLAEPPGPAILLVRSALRGARVRVPVTLVLDDSAAEARV